MIVYRMVIEQEGTYLVSRLNCPENKTFQVFFSRGKRPTSTSYEKMTVIQCMVNRNYNLFPAWQNATSYYIGLKLVSEKVTGVEAMESEDIETNRTTEFLMDMEVFVVGCLFFDEEQEIWIDRGCKVISNYFILFKR